MPPLVTRQVDEADGAGERRPVHLAEVAQDDGDQAAKEGCSHQREHCVDHLWGVLHLPCSKYEVGLDDESDASENKDQVEYFKDPASLLQKDTREQGDKGGLDAADHGEVGEGQQLDGIELDGHLSADYKSSTNEKEALTLREGVLVVKSEEGQVNSCKTKSVPPKQEKKSRHRSFFHHNVDRLVDEDPCYHQHDTKTRQFLRPTNPTIIFASLSLRPPFFRRAC